jgi:aspartyl-tRNA(Asn)/glutamyl-tRNA(Gln) amidotransferase subunit B
MRYLGTCDGNMQEGSLRADVNVSVRKEGNKELGTRCEIKNVNSIKFMQMAIIYEAQRQVELLEAGKSIDQETRLFDTKKNETRSMRSKEDAHDYRYFPDPDLLPLNLNKELIENIKKNLPELPDQKKERFINDYSLTAYEANVLVSEKEISDYFEEVVKTSDIKLAKNWIMGDLFASLNEKNISISQSPVTAKKMSQLIDSISSGVISGRTAKEVFEIMKESGEEPNKIIESKGLQQKSDPKELEKIIEKILTENNDKVEQYKSGKDKLFGFFVGQVMKISGGKANPQLVNQILKNKLKK